MEWKVSLPFLYVDRQRLTQLFICSTNPHYADVKTWAASFKEYVIYIQELLQTFPPRFLNQKFQEIHESCRLRFQQSCVPFVFGIVLSEHSSRCWFSWKAERLSRCWAWAFPLIENVTLAHFFSHPFYHLYLVWIQLAADPLLRYVIIFLFDYPFGIHSWNNPYIHPPHNCSHYTTSYTHWEGKFVSID
jgi:hypothetical protein